MSITHTHAAPLYAENATTAIDGEYVVILKEDLSEKDGKVMPRVLQLYND